MIKIWSAHADSYKISWFFIFVVSNFKLEDYKFPPTEINIYHLFFL